MNEVFNLLFLYVNLYTLQNKTRDHFLCACSVTLGTLGSPLPHRAVAHESTGLFHLQRHQQ